MYRKFVKRLLDFTLALIAIVLLSPLLLVIAILVRINLGGPVLFKHKRPGLNEKIFTMYKFRSMTDTRDKEGNLLPDNLRSTKFGNALRKTSLDELPELFNILKGDMSIVGPRPLMVEYSPYYTDSERKRHDVRPGLTGLAQVNGRNYLSWEERFAYDIRYVKECNLILDIEIIIRTLMQVFKSENVSDMGNIKEDDKGTFVYHEGKVFRRLDVERENYTETN